jgi:hypothetical protein
MASDQQQLTHRHCAELVYNFAAGLAVQACMQSTFDHLVHDHLVQSYMPGLATGYRKHSLEHVVHFCGGL